MRIKSFLGVMAIVSATGLALSQAPTSQADSLDDAVSAGGMGAQIDGFRAFVLPGVMPVTLTDSDSHKRASDTKRMTSTSAYDEQAAPGQSEQGGR